MIIKINSVNYSDIYSYIISKNEKDRVWPKYITEINNKEKQDIAKNVFRKKWKKYFISKDKRLSINIQLKDIFNNSKKI